jgi:hypothetical protein
MNNDIRKEYVTRDTILRLLSDDEIARVSTAETAPRLDDGDEYVDLDAPDRGVQRVPHRPVAPMGHVLTRKAVLDKTWNDIVSLLAAHRNTEAAPSR